MGWTFAVSFCRSTRLRASLQTLTARPWRQTIAWLTDVGCHLTFALFATLAFTCSRRQARARSLAADRRPRAWAGLGDLDRLGVLAGCAVRTRGGTSVVEFPNPIGLLPRTILGLAFHRN
jgi:hypothetical protein